ncbi:cytochrome P450 [Entophlyctis helioformis]|nr:cytochrome P450 [Entophlyctis helioformis]
MVIVSDAEAAKQILNNTVDFSRNPFFQNVGKGLSDYALFTIPSGNMWKKHRKLLQPAFGPSHLRHAAIATSEVVADIAADLNRRIGEAAAAGKPAATVINMYEYMTALTMDVIGKVAFSHEFESVKTIHSQQSSETRTKIEDIFNIICVRSNLPLFAWNWSGVGLKSPRPVAVRQCTYSFVKQILDERRVSSNNGANITKSKWEMDVLDRLLQNNATAKSSADEEIIGEILGFFLAGHETTAHTLTFLMLALCQNPPVMRKLVDEIDAVYEQVDGKVTNENLSHFKYLDWVVKETQRKYNVVNHILRHSNNAVEVGGYSFPANTPFIVNTLDLHNNPTYWPSPESFRPERWAEPPISGSYMPFGDGPTVCVGMKMASIEIRVATIFLLRQFRFEMVEGQTIDIISTITTGLKHGLQVRITERKADEPRSVVAAAAN